MPSLGERSESREGHFGIFFLIFEKIQTILTRRKPTELVIHPLTNPTMRLIHIGEG